MNTFLDSLMQALENEQATDEMMEKVSGTGDPDLASQQEANDPSGNAGSPGDNGNPVAEPDPDSDADKTDLGSQKAAQSEESPAPGDPEGTADPTGASEGDTLEGFPKEVNLHKSHNLIPLQQEKDAQDASGNTGDPAENKQSPVGASGDSKVVHLDKQVLDSYDESGHTDDPGVNGTPVSKSGDSKPLPKNEFENAADDKSGNPDDPGVNGDPAPSFESFITACEQMMIKPEPGIVVLPETMSLESYAMQLGYAQIAKQALEAKLTAAERRNLKDSDFGLPGERGWPIHDEEHVRSAIQNFHWCPKDKQRELAKNILNAMRKFGMKNVEVSQGNPFAQYYPEAKIVARKKPEKKA